MPGKLGFASAQQSQLSLVRLGCVRSKRMHDRILQCGVCCGELDTTHIQSDLLVA